MRDTRRYADPTQYPYQFSRLRNPLGIDLIAPQENDRHTVEQEGRLVRRRAEAPSSHRTTTEPSCLALVRDLA